MFNNKTKQLIVLAAVIFHSMTAAKNVNGKKKSKSGKKSSLRTWQSDSIHSHGITIKNQIQLENELPGSPDWILSNPAMNREVEGYMSRTSVQKGERILLYYSVNPNANMTLQTPPAEVKIEVFRTGWYDGVGARKVFGPTQVPGIAQKMPEPGKDGLIVCKWRDPYVLETSVLWTTGVYLVKMTEMNPASMAQSYAVFVLRDDHRSSTSAADIMFQLPVNTYQAYNIWGGKNLYRCVVSKKCQQARKVSYANFAQKTNFTQSDLHTTYLYVLNKEFKIRAIEVVFNLFALIFPVLIHSPHHRRRTLDRKKNSYQGLRNFVVEKKNQKKPHPNTQYTQKPNTPNASPHNTPTHPNTQTPNTPTISNTDCVRKSIITQPSTYPTNHPFPLIHRPIPLHQVCHIHRHQIVNNSQFFTYLATTSITLSYILFIHNCPSSV